MGRTTTEQDNQLNFVYLKWKRNGLEIHFIIMGDYRCKAGMPEPGVQRVQRVQVHPLPFVFTSRLRVQWVHDMLK